MKYEILLGLLIATSVPTSIAQHQHHHSEGISPEAMAKLGTVHFSISCTPPSHETFERGVAMLHSFWYEEARKQFLSVAQLDPSCAMAQWGLAMTEWRPFWDGMPENRRNAGIAEIDKAKALAAKTEREQLYIKALSDYLHSDPAQNTSAVGAYAAAMRELYRRYPSDTEAQAFYGLGLSASALLGQKDPIGADRKALAVLMPGFKDHPAHPGFAHYIIHTCDNPQLAREGLPAAEKYAAIAPGSAHALHMPGHIFARLGMWPEDIAANLDSVNASELAAKEHQDGVAHEMHAYEFLLYAYLQNGDDAHAKTIYEDTAPLIRHLAAIPGIENDGMFPFTSYVLVEFPSIYHLERHEWTDVLGIPEPEHPLVSSSYFRDWARAIAAGHLRDTTAVDGAVAHAKAIYKEVEAEGSPISAEIRVTFQTMQAWQDYAHGRHTEALAMMSSAADEQDRTGQAEVDVPAREMYADLLLAGGRPAEALKQYKISLQLSPNRFNGLANAARAAKACGRTDEASHYYQTLLKITNNGRASQRPEIAEAHAFLKESHTL